MSSITGHAVHASEKSISGWVQQYEEITKNGWQRHISE